MSIKGGKLSEAIVGEDEDSDSLPSYQHHNETDSAFHNRNKDKSSLRQLEWLIFVPLAGLFLLLLFFSRLDGFYVLLFSILLMGVWAIMLIWASGPLTKWHILIYTVMVIFSIGTVVPLWPQIRLVLAALGLVVIFLQAALLLRTCRSCPPAKTKLQRAFYRSLYIICVVATVSSMTSIIMGFQTWPSTSSLSFAVASIFLFAYASWIASKVTGSRGKRCDQSIFSCGSGYQDKSEFCCFGFLPLLMTGGFVTFLIAVWPQDMPYTSEKDLAFFLALLPLLSVYIATFQHVLLAPLRFHVRCDGAILVETLCKTYFYDKAVRVYLAPKGDPPKETATCHVYCPKDFGKIVVDLTGGQQLILSPEYPLDFINAVIRAIEHPGEVLDTRHKSPKKEENVSNV